MKRVLISLMLLATVYACTGSTPYEPEGGFPEPETPLQPGGGDQENTDPNDPDTPGDPETGDPNESQTPDGEDPNTGAEDTEKPDTQAPGSLCADGNSSATYALITRCGYNYETPDTSGAHASAPFQHIQQSHDAALGKPVFDFYIHVDNDDDRGKTNITDRQRNEIKTDGKSPASMVGQEGETMIFRWKFCLPAGMQTTNKFCHIHQIKGIDNKEETADVGNPVITFTLRTQSNGKQQLQVIYVGRTADATGNVYLGRTDLAPFLGEWVEAEERITFGRSGSYALRIKRLSDGRELLAVQQTAKDMWRDGATGMRPKWGIYRSFGTNGDLKPELRDEILRFADFSIEKLAE